MMEATMANSRQMALVKHHKLKLRFKSLPRRKKEERLLLDMPTTDPGSDLLFSTDDEYIDANGVVTCYGTMPPRIKRHLLKSELQRRYIEEIGDGLRNMPPELIITSPSNKDKQKKHSIRIMCNSTTADKYERKSQTISGLPFIGQLEKRTRSWHNLNTIPQATLLTPGKASATKNKPQSPFYRPLTKKEIISKADLDIKLSLKKKIWVGLQSDDISIMGIDRTRPLSWLAPHSVKSKKIIDDLNVDLNLAKRSSNCLNNKKLGNEAFLTACSRKLMEWQRMNTSPDKSSPCSQNTKVPLKLVAPDTNEDHSIFLFKHLSNIKAANAPQNLFTNEHNAINSEIKPIKTTISQVVETSKIITKISKSKSRISMPNAHRSASKQTLNSHKKNLRTNKFKTGGIVVTAVQTGASVGGSKKIKKCKSLHYKLPIVNSCSINNTDFMEPRKNSTHCSSNNNTNKDSLVTAAATTTIVRRVKTKLKKKKSLSTKQSETNV